MASLDSILGHQDQRSALAEDLAGGNVAHAYLLAGPRHLGKFTIARWFARELLTADASDGAERKRLEGEIERLIHPDLLVIDRLWIEDQSEDLDEIARYSNIAQQHRPKAKAKTDTISIDDIRTLQERLYDVRTRKFRAVLIRSVERMQDEAVTSLLKILEEPPEGLVFLLTTQVLASLLPTLVSRCRVLRFFPLPRRELAPLLTQLGEEEAAFLAHLAQGAPGVIRDLRDDPDRLRAEHTAHANALSFWHARSFPDRLRLLSPLHERGGEADRLLLHLALALREQTPASPVHVQALSVLAAALRTNAQRQLLAQRFALEVSLATETSQR